MQDFNYERYVWALENEQVVVVVIKHDLVQGALLGSLLENYSEFLVAESAITFLQGFEAVVGRIRVAGREKLVKR